jgi:UDP-N-acetylmuramyl tripeptide synthase
MYEGLAVSRNRLSKRVATLQRRADALSEQVNDKNNILVEAFDCLGRTLCEYENLGNLAQAAAAGVQFGVDREDALRKILSLQERIEFMQEVGFSAVAEKEGHAV